MLNGNTRLNQLESCVRRCSRSVNHDDKLFLEGRTQASPMMFGGKGYVLVPR